MIKINVVVHLRHFLLSVWFIDANFTVQGFLCACAALRVCTLAIRCSSCVNLSSLRSASSTSDIPASFFKNLSTKQSTRAGSQSSRTDSLILPCLISLVIKARIRSTSTTTFMIISIISSVKGSSVYVPSLLNIFSIRSKMSRSVSLLALEP